MVCFAMWTLRFAWAGAAPALTILLAFAVVACGGGAASGSSDAIATHDTLLSDDTSASLDGVAGADSATADAPGTADVAADTTPAEAAPADLASTDTALPDATLADVTADVAPDASPSGLSCKQFYSDCLPGCATDAQGEPRAACAQQCLDVLSTDGRDDLDALRGCTEQNGCSAAVPGTLTPCLDANCRDEYYGCFHGDLVCGAMLSCMAACPQTSQACLSTCITDGTVTAQKAYFAVGDCVRQQCCPSDPEACAGADYQGCAQGAFGQQGAPCYDLVAACMNDTGVLPGGGHLPIAAPAWLFEVR